MAQNLQQLAEALRTNRTQQGRVNTLMKQLATAEALRDDPMTQGDRLSGYVSPLSVLADVVKSSRGRKGVRELTPQLEQAQAGLAETADAEKMYTLQQAMEKQQEEQSRYDAEQEIAEQAREDAAAKLSDGKEFYLKSDPKESKMVYTDATGRPVDQYGKAVDISLYTPTDPDKMKLEREKLAAKGGGTGFRPPTAGQQEKFETRAQSGLNLLSSINSFKDAYGSETGLLKVGDIENFISSETPFFASEKMKEQQKWWADYKKNYELTERHELFGSALTAPEQRQWREATINPNLTAQQIKDRLETQKRLTRKIQKKAAEVAKVKGWNNQYVDLVMKDYNFQNDKPETDDKNTEAKDDTNIDLENPPKGLDISKDEWDNFTEAERKEIVFGD